MWALAKARTYQFRFPCGRTSAVYRTAAPAISLIYRCWELRFTKERTLTPLWSQATVQYSRPSAKLGVGNCWAAGSRTFWQRALQPIARILWCASVLGAVAYLNWSPLLIRPRLLLRCRRCYYPG